MLATDQGSHRVEFAMATVLLSWLRCLEKAIIVPARTKEH